MAESFDNCRFMRTLGMPQVAVWELCFRSAPRPDTPIDTRPFVLIPAIGWCREWLGMPSV